MTLLEQQKENKFIAEYDGRLLEPRILSDDSNVYYNVNLNNNSRRDFYSLKNEVDSNESGISIGGGLLSTLNIITTSYIDDNAITSNKIYTGAVIGSKFASGAVWDAMSNILTATQIASNAVTSASLGSGSVKNNNVADGAVTTAKIADDGIVPYNSSVGEKQITTSKIVNNSITPLSPTFNSMGVRWGSGSNIWIDVYNQGVIEDFGSM
jgi:hypothetical protein